MSSFYLSYGKRVLDLVTALPLLAVLSPLLLLLALLVRISQCGPAFFVQERAGLGGRTFRIIKLRIMRHAVDTVGRLLADEKRLTRLGVFLRRSSLDELPELVNVLLGQMSLVGPRPLPVEYLARYTLEQARRHEVRPGITGWAQVNGRNTLSWEDKFTLDVWYVDHHSLGLDLRILWMTLVQVVQRKGISAEGHPTMREFMGSGEKRR